MATKPPINQTQIELQAKFAEIVDRLLLLMQEEGWARIERDGVAPYTARLQDKAHLVHLELTLKPRNSGKASISCLFTTPTVYSNARAIASLKFIQMQAPVDAVVRRILAGYAEAMPSIDESMADFLRSVKAASAETKTLREIWQMLGGDKPSYVSFKRIDTYGVPDVRIERQGTNSLQMLLDKLTNHQALEIAKLLADNEGQPPLPHPSETLKVDDLGIVYCVDAMVGKDLETGRSASTRSCGSWKPTSGTPSPTSTTKTSSS